MAGRWFIYRTLNCLVRTWMHREHCFEVEEKWNWCFGCDILAIEYRLPVCLSAIEDMPAFAHQVSIYRLHLFTVCAVFSSWKMVIQWRRWWHFNMDRPTIHTYIFYLHPFANMFRSLVRRMFFPSYQTCPSRVTLWTATHTHTFPLCASTILCLNHFRFEFQ